MQKLFSMLFCCCCHALLGQETPILLEKAKEEEIKKELMNSQLTNDEYKQLIYEKSASEKGMLQLKEEVLIELQIKAQEKVLQQQTIIGDDKENEQTIAAPPIKKPQSSNQNSSTAHGDVIDSTFISVNEYKAMLIATIESESETDNNRLFGPSQYDSRIEPFYFDMAIYWQQQILEVSNSVGMIIERERITQYTKDVYQIDDQQTLGKRYNLCPEEAFYSQPVVGVGTAWLYDTNKMITASHVFERSIENYVVIFGYQILNSKGLIDVFIPKSRIYDIQKIIQKDLDLDLVAFELDRSALGVPLQWENTPKGIGGETEIYMIGYPTGLPLKIAMNASIEENNHPNYFYTSLDSFQGNSGSPVFNFYTNKVIGVLVSGEIDYKFNGNCYYSPLCKTPYCKGEKVVKLNSFLANY